jgi:hypothetical protein
MKPQVSQHFGECCQVTKVGETEPGLQVGSPLTSRVLRLGVLRVAELEGDHDLRDAAEQGEEANPDQQ